MKHTRAYMCAGTVRVISSATVSIVSSLNVQTVLGGILAYGVINDHHGLVDLLSLHVV